jgi:hypothetical protein
MHDREGISRDQRTREGGTEGLQHGALMWIR